MADIMITARDRMSDTLKKIEANTRQFSTSLEDTNKKLDMLNKNKVTLKIDAREARKELSEAMKDYDLAVKNMNSSAEKMAEAQKARENVIAKSMNYEKVKGNLSAVTKEIRNTEKAFNDLGNAQRKLDNKFSGNGQNNNVNMDLADFVGNQLIGGMKKVAMQGIQYYIGSAYGNATGNILNNMLSGGLSGWAAGSVIPGVGNVTGAVIGAGVGAMTGVLQNEQSKDNLFKSYVSDRVSNINQMYEENIQAGSKIAGQREIDKIAFNTLLGRDPTEFLGNILNFANTTPFLYDDLTGMSKTLLTYDYTEKELMPTLKAIGNAGATLGKSSAEMNQIATVLGRMNLGGDLSTIQVKMLQNYGIKAYEALGKAWGMSTDQARDKVSGGGVDAKEAAQIIVDYMAKNFDGAMEKMSQTFNGLSSTVEGLQQQRQNAYGEAYNEAKKADLQNQIRFENQYGDQEDEASKIIANSKAKAEKIKNNVIRNHVIDMMESEKYKKAVAENDGVTIKILRDKAEQKGEQDFYSSPYGQKVQASQIELIDGVRDTAAENRAVLENQYKIQQEMSKGIMSTANNTAELVAMGNNISIKVDRDGSVVGTRESTQNYELKRDRDGAEVSKSTGTTSGPSVYNPFVKKKFISHAVGINYVPYNGYNAVLHEGERVLTARENRNYKDTGNGVVISGNNFTVREEADIDKIARALLEKIEQADLSYVG